MLLVRDLSAVTLTSAAVYSQKRYDFWSLKNKLPEGKYKTLSVDER